MIWDVYLEIIWYFLFLIILYWIYCTDYLEVLRINIKLGKIWFFVVVGVGGSLGSVTDLYFMRRRIIEFYHQRKPSKCGTLNLPCVWKFYLKNWMFSTINDKWTYDLPSTKLINICLLSLISGANRILLSERDDASSKPDLLSGLLRGPQHLLRNPATPARPALPERGNPDSPEQAEPGQQRHRADRETFRQADVSHKVKQIKVGK